MKRYSWSYKWGLADETRYLLFKGDDKTFDYLRFKLQKENNIELETNVVMSYLTSYGIFEFSWDRDHRKEELYYKEIEQFTVEANQLTWYDDTKDFLTRYATPYAAPYHNMFETNSYQHISWQDWPLWVNRAAHSAIEVEGLNLQRNSFLIMLWNSLKPDFIVNNSRERLEEFLNLIKDVSFIGKGEFATDLYILQLTWMLMQELKFGLAEYFVDVIDIKSMIDLDSNKIIIPLTFAPNIWAEPVTFKFVDKSPLEKYMDLLRGLYVFGVISGGDPLITRWFKERRKEKTEISRKIKKTREQESPGVIESWQYYLEVHCYRYLFENGLRFESTWEGKLGGPNWEREDQNMVASDFLSSNIDKKGWIGYEGNSSDIYKWEGGTIWDLEVDENVKKNGLMNLDLRGKVIFNLVKRYYEEERIVRDLVYARSIDFWTKFKDLWEKRFRLMSWLDRDGLEKPENFKSPSFSAKGSNINFWTKFEDLWEERCKIMGWFDRDELEKLVKLSSWRENKSKIPFETPYPFKSLLGNLKEISEKSTVKLPIIFSGNTGTGVVIWGPYGGVRIPTSEYLRLRESDRLYQEYLEKEKNKESREEAEGASSEGVIVDEAMRALMDQAIIKEELQEIKQVSIVHTIMLCLFIWWLY